jgi:hypothetical protein
MHIEKKNNEKNIEWVDDQINFLVCHAVGRMMKKYNLERHYQSCHGRYEVKQNGNDIVYELMTKLLNIMPNATFKDTAKCRKHMC